MTQTMPSLLLDRRVHTTRVQQAYDTILGKRRYDRAVHSVMYNPGFIQEFLLELFGNGKQFAAWFGSIWYPEINSGRCWLLADVPHHFAVKTTFTCN